MIDKLIRQIDIFDKKTDGLTSEIGLDSFDLELMKSRFNVASNDPLMYNPYEIDSSNVDLFPNVKFDFNEYSYYLACYNDSETNK
jgi:hypothetical protein